jgi:hypothetical protein
MKAYFGMESLTPMEGHFMMITISPSLLTFLTASFMLVAFGVPVMYWLSGRHTRARRRQLQQETAQFLAACGLREEAVMTYLLQDPPVETALPCDTIPEEL